MAIVDNYLEIPGLAAGEDMSAKQYRGVKMHTTAFQVVGLTDANAEQPIGILQNDPTSGEAATVAFCGVCKAECGGIIAVGASVAFNNSGDVISDVEVKDGTAVDLHHIGYALEAGVDTQVIKIILRPPVRIGLE